MYFCVFKRNGLRQIYLLFIFYVWWQFFLMQWAQYTFGCISISVNGGYHAVKGPDFKTALMKHPIDATLKRHGWKWTD